MECQSINTNWGTHYGDSKGIKPVVPVVCEYLYSKYDFARDPFHKGLHFVGFTIPPGHDINISIVQTHIIC